MLRTTPFILLLTLIAPITAQAQRWSAVQQEVWQAVSDCWTAWLEENDSAAKDCFHEDYAFWWAEDVLPFGKDRVQIYWQKLREGDRVVTFDLRPAGILVRGDVALVHWGATIFTRDAAGNPDSWSERASMTLVKEGGRWRYLGGGGSPIKK